MALSPRPERPTGYTTVLKLLQIMTDKGVVGRDESERANVFAATVSERPFRSGLGELTS